MEQLFKRHYTCTLLTNLVLTATAATEGFPHSLKYIPGAKWLGMVAGTGKMGYYSQLDLEEAKDLFHNGVVRYGDAFPFIDGELFYKPPFCWETPKGKKHPIYLFVTKEQRAELLEQGDKLERIALDYFSSKKSLNLEEQFAIKSAYNQETLRSKESGMFGYNSLERGATWAFTIESKEEKYLEDIERLLLGKKRIGRSRSAEYGMVDIKAIPSLPTPLAFTPTGAHVYLYAASNCCFYDKHGNCRPSPIAADLDLPAGATIDWAKSAIRTRTYRTWNQQRQNRNEDRLIMERGSVIAIRLEAGVNLDAAAFEKGIGSHKNEGFGRVLLNPWFLNDQQLQLDLELTKQTIDTTSNPYGKTADSSSDAAVLAFVKKRKKTTERVLDIDLKVNEFIKANWHEYEAISASQWGQMRRYAKQFNTVSLDAYRKLIFAQDIGFLYRGRMENVWRKKQRRETLEQYLFEKTEEQDRRIIPDASVLEFVMKLSAQMAKGNRE